MESNIAPLAKRLAEENNVNWRHLEGSGPDGRIIERDVLEYLARVMAGEEAVDPTPEPVPEGMDAWPVEDTGERAAAASQDHEAEPDDTDDTDDTDDEDFGGVFGDLDDEALLEAEEAAPSNPAATELEPDDALGDDIFLFDDDDEEEIAAVQEESSQTSHGGAAIRDDEEEIDFSELAEDDDFDLAQSAPGGDDEEGMPVDLDFGEEVLSEDDDALAAQGLEDDLSATAPAGDASEAEDDAVFDFEDDLIGSLDDSLDDDEALTQAEADTPDEDDLFAEDEDIFGEPPDEEPVEVFAFEEDGDDLFVADDDAPGARALDTDESDDSDAFLSIDALDEAPADTGAPPPEATAAEEDSALSFDPEDTLDIDRDEAFEPRAPLDHLSGASSTEPAAEADAPAVPEAAASELPDAPPQEAPAPLDMGLVGAAAQQASAEEIPPTSPEAVPAEPAGLPLSSYPQVLRRHVELSELAKAQLSVGRALEAGDPISPAVFLLRAAAKVLHASSDAGDVRVGLAVLSEQGVGVQVIPNAAEMRFDELYKAVTQAQASKTTERQDATLIVADMSALDVDEAVLALGAPLLTLGRILYDKTSAGYRSMLSLSGEVNPEEGAALLRGVNELFDEPVRLVL